MYIEYKPIQVSIREEKRLFVLGNKRITKVDKTAKDIVREEEGEKERNDKAKIYNKCPKERRGLGTLKLRLRDEQA